MECYICEDDIFKGEDGRWYMRVETSHWDYNLDGFDYVDIHINFCPICGKKYE